MFRHLVAFTYKFKKKMEIFEMYKLVYKSVHKRFDCENSIHTDRKVAWFLLKLLLITLLGV
jgi:zona occludens toxin (predicted ATPase)